MTIHSTTSDFDNSSATGLATTLQASGAIRMTTRMGTAMKRLAMVAVGVVGDPHGQEEHVSLRKPLGHRAQGMWP